MAVDFLPLPGTPADEIDTPAMIVDLDAAEANIRKMQDFADANGFSVRPHTKTSKSAYWAMRQIEAGAPGVCVAKVGEAEVLVDGGVRDILIANEVVGPVKTARLAALARRASLRVAVDDEANARELSAAAVAAGSEIGVLVDVNIRLDRCGVEPGEPATTLAGIVDSLPRIRFDGLMGYEGHIHGIGDARIPETMEAIEKLRFAVSDVRAAGLPVNVVSAGGTSTYDITGRIPEVTEVQAGSYVFMDGAYIDQMVDFEMALTVATQVISRPVPERAILDIGLKSMADDYGPPRVVGLEGAEFTKLSEEHGTLLLSGAAQDLEVGDRVYLLPSHAGTTINVHDYYFCVRDGVLAEVVEVAGRGKFR